MGSQMLYLTIDKSPSGLNERQQHCHKRHNRKKGILLFLSVLCESVRLQILHTGKPKWGPSPGTFLNLGDIFFYVKLASKFINIRKKSKRLQGQPGRASGSVHALCCSGLGFAGSDPGRALTRHLSGHGMVTSHIEWRKMCMDVSPGPVFLSKRRRSVRC